MRLILAASFLLSAVVAVAKPHLELELDSPTYARLLAERGTFTDGELTKVQNMGKRLMEWLVYINKFRAPENQISLSAPETQMAYPVESPGFNNESLVLKKYDQLRSSLPAWMTKVLFENGDLVKELPVPDSEFIQLGAQVDRNYQSASRWLLQQPYLSEYALEKENDIRGYYFLSRETNLAAKWTGWSNLSAEEQTKILGWVQNVCENSGTQKTCKTKVNQAKTDGKKVAALYNSYQSASAKTFQNYFKLQNARKDMKWTEANLAQLPFIRPDKQVIENFLSKEIEDEWRWQDWKLQLQFVSSGNDTTHLVFEAGTTPHVNKLGGSEIVMDENTPLTEYNVRWTIRHEFGHVLGFPDCYVEFYDSEQKAMVNYQIDTSNLMCSRRGKLKQTHYDEMKRAYYH